MFPYRKLYKFRRK